MGKVKAAKEKGKGSVAKRILSSCFDLRTSYLLLDERGDINNVSARGNIMQREAFRASMSVYGSVSLAFLPVLGVSVFSLGISWNTASIDLYFWMADALQSFTFFFQACFALVSIFVWGATGLLAYTDTTACLLAPFADWYWRRRYDSHGVLSATDLTLFCLLTGYQTARVWTMTVKPRRSSWKSWQGRNVNTLERLEVHWITRSASLVSEILPQISDTWGQLVDMWGYDKAAQVCKVSVHVTDPDCHQVALLRQQIESKHIFRHGCLSLGRPDLEEIIRDHTLELVCTRGTSCTLLAFCGSPGLASELHQAKISNDMLSSITGNKNHHQMEFVSESYSGQRKATTRKSKETPAADAVVSPKGCRDSTSEKAPKKVAAANELTVSSRYNTGYRESECDV